MKATPTVLVVDDDPDVLESVSDLIQMDLCYNVVTAPSGEHGLGILRSQPVDVVLSDFRMPGMDGCVFLRHAHEMRPKVPCLMMTAYPNPQLEQELCNDLSWPILRKPIDADDLGQILRDAVQ
ncbi:MAG TPA: response regulator [Candidatus Thermoplasmatota archaeon]|nr:response regulator [Candidatus Thermoplasmatota archaeon]